MKLHNLRSTKKYEVVKTGFAALDKKIGGGLEKGSVTILFGDNRAVSIFCHDVMLDGMEKTSKSKFLKVTGVNDMDRTTILAIKDMAVKYGLVVIVTFWKSDFKKKDELPYVLKDIAENVFHLKNVPGLCESYVELEVLKNRSKGLHDKKFMFTAWTNDLRL